MEALDWIVIGVFALALIGIIVWVVKQKQNDSADYFLGGRDATWIAIGASIFASNIGSEHLLVPEHPVVWLWHTGKSRDG